MLHLNIFLCFLRSNNWLGISGLFIVYGISSIKYIFTINTIILLQASIWSTKFMPRVGKKKKTWSETKCLLLFSFFNTVVSTFQIFNGKKGAAGEKCSHLFKIDIYCILCNSSFLSIFKTCNHHMLFKKC